MKKLPCSVLPCLAILAALVLVATLVNAQAESTGPTATTSTSAPFDVKSAVDAYLNSVPAAARARSDAYFEGGYWLQLWDFLVAVIISLLLLNTRLSAKMRDLAERMTRFTPIQTLIYWIEFLLITTLLQLPLGVYEGFFYERKYGL